MLLRSIRHLVLRRWRAFFSSRRFSILDVAQVCFLPASFFFQMLEADNISFDFSEIVPLLAPPLLTRLSNLQRNGTSKEDQLCSLELFRTLLLLLKMTDAREALLDLNVDHYLRKQASLPDLSSGFTHLLEELQRVFAIPLSVDLELLPRRFRFGADVTVQLHCGAESKMGTGWKVNYNSSYFF